jgi:class 3 adenylate cyclase
VEIRDTWYAKTPEGVHIAYQLVGDGPVDLVYQGGWGNIDFLWQLPLDRAWTEALSSIGRVILHDPRATGLSSRNVAPPNLETRVSDLELVLDTVASERPVLLGSFESGAPNVLLAATRPERVHRLVWSEPVARQLWAPDYPWGAESEVADEALRMNAEIGTIEYGRKALEFQSSLGNPSEEMAEILAISARNTYTPDIAEAFDRILLETDVRGVLPAVQTPTLLLAHEDRESTVEETNYVASLMPSAQVRLMPGGTWTINEVRAWVEEIRRFIGVEPPGASLDTILTSVLFTDIVGSTERQAALGDHAWKALMERHHGVVRECLVRWRGVEQDTSGDGFYATFDGPARAIRCALEVSERIRTLGIEIRAGIHTGECELINGKVGGIAVTIGARIAALAGQSEILISQTVMDLVAGSGLTFEAAGEHELKGIPNRWHLYRVAG